MGDSGKVGSTRKSGVHEPSANDAIATAVATALATVLPEALERIRDESSDRHAIKELQSSVNASLRDIRNDYKATADSLGGKIDSIRADMAEGTATFRVHEHRLKAVEARLDEHSDAYRRSAPLPTPTVMTQPQIGGSSGLIAARKDKHKDAPLISPKVWNTLLLAIVGGAGTALGAWGWERLRGADKQEATAPPALTQPAPHQLPVNAPGPVIPTPGRTPTGP